MTKLKVGDKVRLADHVDIRQVAQDMGLSKFSKFYLPTAVGVIIEIRQPKDGYDTLVVVVDFGEDLNVDDTFNFAFSELVLA